MISGQRFPSVARVLAGITTLLWVIVWLLVGWGWISRIATTRYPEYLDAKGNPDSSGLPQCSGPAVAMEDAVWRYCTYSDGNTHGFVRFDLAGGVARQAWPVEIGDSKALGVAPGPRGEIALIVPSTGFILRLAPDGGVGILGQLPSRDRLLGLAWHLEHLEVVQGRRGNLLFLSFDGNARPRTRRLVLPWRTAHGLCSPAVAQFSDDRWTTWLSCENPDRDADAKLQVAMLAIDDAGVEVDVRTVETYVRPSVPTIDMAVDRSSGGIARWQPFRILLVQRQKQWLAKTLPGGADKEVERDYVVVDGALVPVSRTQRQARELRVSLPTGPADLTRTNSSLTLSLADGSASAEVSGEAALLNEPRILPRAAGGVWLLADDGLYAATHDSLAPARPLGLLERVIRLNQHFERRTTDAFFNHSPTLKRIVLLSLLVFWPLCLALYFALRRRLGPVMRPVFLYASSGLYMVLILSAYKWLWTVLGVF